MGVDEYRRAAEELGDVFQAQSEREMRLCIKTISKLTRRHIDQEESESSSKPLFGGRKYLSAGTSDGDNLDVSDALKKLNVGDERSSHLRVPGVFWALFLTPVSASRDTTGFFDSDLPPHYIRYEGEWGYKFKKLV